MTRPITPMRDGRSASHAADVALDSAGQPTDPAGPTGRLSTWLANTTLDDVPATVRDRAKHLILDGFACATGEAAIDEIARIDIDMSEAPYSHGGWQATRPLTTIGAQMNAAYAVAVALLDGSVLIDQFSQRRINSDDMWRLIDRTHTHHEKSYDALPESQRLTTRVVITLQDGTTREQLVTQPRGTGDHQLTNAQIVDKYRNLTQLVIEPDRRHAIENAVLGLETLDDIAILTGMLNPPVNAALAHSRAARRRGAPNTLRDAASVLGPALALLAAVLTRRRGVHSAA